MVKIDNTQTLTHPQADILDKALEFYMHQVIDKLPNSARQPLAQDWQAVWSVVGKLRKTEVPA